jgi:hypothetical protein
VVSVGLLPVATVLRSRLKICGYDIERRRDRIQVEKNKPGIRSQVEKNETDKESILQQGDW